MKRLLFPALLAGLLLIGAACDPVIPWIEISQSSSAPPAREAEIVNDSYDDIHSIRLSVGVSILVECYSQCDWSCVDPQFVAADPSLLDVLPVEDSQYRGGYVLVGRAVGQTTLTVSSDCAEQIYDVEVLSATATP